MEYAFIGGSLGVVAGEKITRALELALTHRHPAIIVSCSGGARMMEGALSLMQMAKVSAALARLDRARVPFISVLTDPTTGGVTASFAMLGDLNIAEPKALIGFAGPRVIEQTIRQTLPEGFQRSEFLLEHGMLDLVVDRRDLKASIARALRFMRAVPAAVSESGTSAGGVSGESTSRRRVCWRCARRGPPGAAATNTVLRTEPHSGPIEERRSEATLTTFDRLFALETFGIKLGLDNISTLCDALGHPERAFRSLHVAGTNGKGSVTAMTHAALRAAGIRAGRYTSPHLSNLAERFVIDDRPVDAMLLESTVDDVLSCADRLRASGALSVHPTFFEATTAAAFELFRRSGVEVGVIEVGLGGRFDATNVIMPVAGAITTIDFDHQQHLGDTLGAIAFEKAGIIKPGMTVVMGDLRPDAETVIRRCAAERGAALVDAIRDTRCQAEMIDGRAQLTIATPSGSYGPLTLGLRGEHQVGNAIVAVRLLEVAAGHGIHVPQTAIEQGLAAAEWPARLELLDRRARPARAARCRPQSRGRTRPCLVPDPVASRASAARHRRHARQERCRHRARAAAGCLVGHRHGGADTARHPGDRSGSSSARRGCAGRARGT